MNKKLFLQTFKFSLVGGIAFIIDYLVLIFCKEVLNLNILIGSSISFSISLIVNYFLSINYVFDVNKNDKRRKKFILFIIFSIVGLLLTLLIMWFGTNILKINYLIAKILATFIVMCFNFITRKIFLEK